MSAGTRGAVVTTVLSILFVPVFTNHSVQWDAHRSWQEQTVVQCTEHQDWEPHFAQSVTGAPPSPPAPWTQVTTTVEGKCVDHYH